MGRWVLWASIVITVVVTMGAQPDLRSVLTLTLAALAVALAAAIGFASSRAAAVAGRPEQARWLKLVHYTPVLSVAFLPLAASVYLVTSMAWTVPQTLVLRQVLS